VALAIPPGSLQRVNASKRLRILRDAAGARPFGPTSRGNSRHSHLRFERTQGQRIDCPSGKLRALVRRGESDGDIFTYFFKKYRLGPVIGTRTWDGVRGIRGFMPLMDGGYVSRPEFSV
jgi:C-terminal processing protease CtpA/Prc